MGLLSIVSVKCLICNNQTLNLVRAFVNLHDFCVTHVFFDRIFLDIAIAAHDLDCIGRDLHGYVGRVAFGNGRFAAEVHALVFHPAGAMDEETGSFDFHGHVGDHGLDHFKRSDGFAELDADFSIFAAGAESRFGNADGNGADERTGSVQGIHGDTEAMAFAAEAVFDRDEAVLEDEFRRVGSADPDMPTIMVSTVL